jgi:hypothetical protein
VGEQGVSGGEAAHLGWVTAHLARARWRVRAARGFISPKAAGAPIYSCLGWFPRATSTLGIFHDKRYMANRPSCRTCSSPGWKYNNKSENEGREESVDWVWKLLSRQSTRPGHVAMRSKCRAQERERGKARMVNQSIHF